MGGTREENREPEAGSREAPQFGRVFVGVSSMWSVSKAKKRQHYHYFRCFRTGLQTGLLPPHHALKMRACKRRSEMHVQKTRVAKEEGFQI